jgi:Zn ribbon nucleic-acid-binding protein
MKTVLMEQTLQLLHENNVDVQSIVDTGVVKKVKDKEITYLVIEENEE